MSKRFVKLLVTLVLVSIIAPVNLTMAATVNNYPKLANYYLRWSLADYEVPELAKWDLLILDMETAVNSPDKILQIRKLNPKIIILGYVTSQEIIDDVSSLSYGQEGSLRAKLRSQIDDNWWLRDGNGQRVSFWPGTYMLNLSDAGPVGRNGQRFNDFFPEFVKKEIYDTGFFDGVLLDNLWGDVSWVNGDRIDINNNGLLESYQTVNQSWLAGVKKLTKNTRALLGAEALIVGNGRIFKDYQSYLNGMMLENFPSSWEGGGTWAGSMKSYFNLEGLNQAPAVAIINSYNQNRKNYQKMRYGLASTLMRDNGYYSYDYDNSAHSQLWWYDEYDVSLGEAQYPAYNVLDRASDALKAGLWRRDFAEGIALVNSTAKAQTYIFNSEEFEKINGSQDPSINNGTRINWIKVPPEDGVILLKRKTEITNNVFYNNYFMRVFDDRGIQKRNGFFSYLDNFLAGTPVFSSDLDGDGIKEIINAYQGKIALYKQGKKIKEFMPFNNFKGALSVSIADIDGNGLYEIAVAPADSGPAQIAIYSLAGKRLGVFSPYGDKFRGPINISMRDINGDKTPEIMVVPGAGNAPELKIFSTKGKLLKSFWVNDKKSRIGWSVTSGDVNGDGKLEIITGNLAGATPEIRIYNSSGKLLGQFLAFDKSYKKGVRVLCEDIDDDGEAEILTSISGF